MKRSLVLFVFILACDSKPTQAPTSSALPKASAKPSASAKAGTAASGAPSAATSSTPDERVAYARSLVGQFAKSLKAELMKGLKEGPENAVAVCNEKAPEIAESLATEKGWSIRRTSLKLRNPKNAPDEWEKSVLERFEKQLEDGTKLEELEVHEVVTEGETRKFRYMKAIGTAGMCLTCHGDTIEDELAAKIDELYPKDEARGFSTGDIRGAFTITKEL
jgi:hypothetical protein